MMRDGRPASASAFPQPWWCCVTWSRGVFACDATNRGDAMRVFSGFITIWFFRQAPKDKDVFFVAKHPLFGNSSAVGCFCLLYSLPEHRNSSSQAHTLDRRMATRVVSWPILV